MALLKNTIAGDVLPLASPPATVRSYDILTYSNGKVAPSVFLSCREQTLTMHVNGVPFVRICATLCRDFSIPAVLLKACMISPGWT